MILQVGRFGGADVRVRSKTLNQGFGILALIYRRNLMSASMNAGIVPLQKLLPRASVLSRWRSDVKK